MKLRKMFFAERVERIHIGSGPQMFDSWLNVDNVRYPGVDRVLDVTRGLPFRDVRFIYAEHFIEHLDYNDARYFLRECRRVLRNDGVLRLSTPNLDWVWTTQYHLGTWSDREQPVQDCFAINKAFRAWGHRFLYNLDTLMESLRNAGFASIRSAAYGESDHPELRGLERHEKYHDAPELPHIIIVEASGRAAAESPAIAKALPDYQQAMSAE